MLNLFGSGLGLVGVCHLSKAGNSGLGERLLAHLGGVRYLEIVA